VTPFQFYFDFASPYGSIAAMQLERVDRPIVWRAFLLGAAYKQVGQRSAVAASVGLYTTAAYWFNASTSFANPAVTIARALSDVFAGIRRQDALSFLSHSSWGALAAAYACGWLLAERSALVPKPGPTE
jgi:hypothetical protein